MHVNVKGWTRHGLPEGTRLIAPNRRGSITIVPTKHALIAGARRVTDAGELAFVRQTSRGRIAVVPNADATLVIAAEGDNELFTVLDQIVQSIVTGDDPLRARTPLHRPPDGWEGARRPYVTTWTNGMSSIEVRDALPLGSRAAFTAELLQGRATTEIPTDARAFVSATGLNGLRWTIGAALVIELADSRFTYRARLDGNDIPSFMSVVDSLEPVPQPRATTNGVLSWCV